MKAELKQLEQPPPMGVVLSMTREEANALWELVNKLHKDAPQINNEGIDMIVWTVLDGALGKGNL